MSWKWPGLVNSACIWHAPEINGANERQMPLKERCFTTWNARDRY